MQNGLKQLTDTHFSNTLLVKCVFVNMWEVYDVYSKYLDIDILNVSVNEMMNLN